MTTPDQPVNDPIEAVPPTAEEIERLSAANDATLQQLAAQGMKIDQGNLTNVRLQLLTETLLGPLTEPGRLAFEYRFHTTVAQALADLGAQVRKLRLMDGVKPGSIKVQRTDPRGGR